MGNLKKNPKRPELEAEIADAVDRYAHMVAVEGYTETEAWEATHPQSRAKPSSRRSLACAFAQRPEVAKRMQEIREEMRKTREAFRDQLVQFHIDDIVGCVRNEHSLANCMEQVKSLNKIMGYEQTKVAVEAKVAAVDESALQDKLAFLLGKEAAK